ncbi:MAG TPA: YraN family protein [Planctomycetota bacterium]|nr:YraN family protein [Planctomycetota bacterium]
MAARDSLGAEGEEYAWQLLKKRGDRLVARNFSCPQGELDLVTWHKDTLVFTEVRARSSGAFGSAAETITRGKQGKVKRAANWFCVKNFKGKALPSCRFDVVWLACKDGKVSESGIIEGAFI